MLADQLPLPTRSCVPSQAKQAQRAVRAQHSQARHQASAVDRCQLCWDSARRAQHLTLAAAQTCYLALPARWRPAGFL